MDLHNRPAEWHISTVDMGLARPKTVRIMLVQTQWHEHDFVRKDGLAFIRDASENGHLLERVLARARQGTCDAVLLPELSVHEDCVELARNWSQSTGSVVIAGTHYFSSRGTYVSRCRVYCAAWSSRTTFPVSN
jgi:hypothetical protein